MPGVRSIVNVIPSTTDQAIIRWTGTIEADFINHNGGVDRTNLHVIFKESNGKLWCTQDADYYEKEFQAHLAAIKAGKE